MLLPLPLSSSSFLSEIQPANSTYLLLLPEETLASGCSCLTDEVEPGGLQGAAAPTGPDSLTDADFELRIQSASLRPGSAAASLNALKCKLIMTTSQPRSVSSRLSMKLVALSSVLNAAVSRPFSDAASNLCCFYTHS